MKTNELIRVNIPGKDIVVPIIKGKTDNGAGMQGWLGYIFVALDKIYKDDIVRLVGSSNQTSLQTQHFSPTFNGNTDINNKILLYSCSSADEAKMFSDVSSYPEPKNKEQEEIIGLLKEMDKIIYNE